MSDNVVDIEARRRSRSTSTQPEIVRMLEALAEKARSGEIVGIAYAIATKDSFGTGYTWTDDTDGNAHRVMAGTGLLFSRVMADIDGDR